MTEHEADQLYEHVQQMDSAQLCALWRWLMLEWVKRYEEERKAE